MWILGKTFCGLGVLALVLLGLDMITGHVGFEFPGGLLRFLILLPLAVVGALSGFLMLRAQSGDRKTRRLLLLGTVLPLLAMAAVFAGSLIDMTAAAHTAFVLVLVAVWLGFGLVILASGRRLARFELRGLVPPLLVGVGLALLIQGVGAGFGAIFGPDRAWPGDLAFAGVVAAGALMAVTLALIVLTRRRGRPA